MGGRGRAVRAGWAIPMFLACSGSGPAPGESGPEVERIIAGDTTIVRNHSATGVWGDTMTVEVELEIGALEGAPEVTFGNVPSLAVRPDGSILVLDADAPALREFDPEGRFVRSLGRRGQGPGEFERPMAVRVDREGRTLVLDWTGRMTIFGSDGTAERSWQFENFYPAYSFTVDTLGNTYVQIRGSRPPTSPMADPSEGMRLAYVRYSPEGEPGDTVPEGGWLFDSPGPSRATVSSPYATKENFKPLGIALIHPFGWTLTGSTDRYSVVLTPHSLGDDGAGAGSRERILRIERTVDPPPIHPEEGTEWRDYLEARLERTIESRARLPLELRMQLAEPEPYYFPETPVKPYLKWPGFGEDGRIWLQRHAPSVKEPPSALPPETAPGDGPPPLPDLTWVEPVHYDVFELDGTFLGTVVVPPELAIFVRGTERVWGVRKDELEVPYVFRARLVPLRGTAADSE